MRRPETIPQKKDISQGDQKVYYQKQPPELFCKKRFS